FEVPPQTDARTRAVIVIAGPAISPSVGQSSASGGTAALDTERLPTDMNFPSQPVGSFCAPKQLLFTNTAIASLQSVSVFVTPPGQFIATHDCASTLPGGQSCTINVQARPAAAGPLSGTLVVSSSLQQPSELRIALIAAGVGGPPSGD